MKTLRILLPGPLLLVALLVFGSAEAETVNIDGLIVTEGGASWTFITFDAVRDLSPALQNVVAVRDAALLNPPKGDAFDGFWKVSVGGFLVRLQPGPNGDMVTDATGTTVTATPTTVAGLNVTLQFFMSRDLPVMRVLVILQNPGPSGVTVQVALPGDLGSDGDTLVETSASSDAGLTDADRWVISSDATLSDPVIGTVFFGPGGPGGPAVRPRAATLVEDRLNVSYSVRVPPGATRRVMVFSQLSADPAAARTAITTFDTNEALTAPGLLSGLDAQAQTEIVNWTLGFPTVCADRTGC